MTTTTAPSTLATAALAYAATDGPFYVAELLDGEVVATITAASEEGARTDFDGMKDEADGYAKVLVINGEAVAEAEAIDED